MFWTLDTQPLLNVALLNLLLTHTVMNLGHAPGFHAIRVSIPRCIVRYRTCCT